MIFGSINYRKNYSYLQENILKCLDYAIDKNLLELKAGRYEIDGDNIFVNIVEYETADRDDRFWEAHKKYIDIHLMLEGSEKIELNFVDSMTQIEYKEDTDFLKIDEQKGNSHVKLQKGDFLVCYPEDAHMTGIKVKDKTNIKKAIFKVRV